MRASTKGKHEIRKRFALVIGVAAAGVMALGAVWLTPSTFATREPAFTCGQAGTVFGTAGNDTLSGTPADDVIASLGGNDKVSGLGGNDLICGGAGKDTLMGNEGHDQLLGQKGNDTLMGGGGKDRCEGQEGNDIAKKCENASAEVGVLAQTAAPAPAVVEYPTKLTIFTDGTASRRLINGQVRSGIPAPAGSGISGIPVRECEEGREVILFKKRPGADRRLATTLSVFRALDPVAAPDYGAGNWDVPRGVGKRAAAGHAPVYAMVTPKVGDGFVCLGDLTTVLVPTEFGLLHKWEIKKKLKDLTNG